MKNAEIKKIKAIIEHHLNVDVKTMLANGDIFDNSKEIKKVSKILVERIHKGFIPAIKSINPTKQTVLDIYNLFPIALTTLNPADFEGVDALSVEELIDIASLYIFEEIKENRISGLSL